MAHPPIPSQAIQSVLEQAKRRERRLRHFRGALTALLFLAALTAAGAVFDRFVPGSRSTRWIIAWSAYALAAAGIFWLWLRPALQPISNIESAWLVERNVGGLNEKLVSAVELGDPSEDLSAEMIRQVTASVAAEARYIPLERVSPLSRARRPALALAALLSAFLLLSAVPSVRFHRLAARFWYPEVRYGRIGRFEILPARPHPALVPRGDPYPFDFVTTSSDVDELRIDIRLANGSQRSRLLARDRDGHFRFAFPGAQEDFDYEASALRVSTDRCHVRVLPRPNLWELVKTIDWPAYTGRGRSRETSSSGDMEAIPGSRGELLFRASRDAQSAFLVLGEKEVPLAAYEDGEFRCFSCAFVFDQPFDYRLRLVSPDGLENGSDPSYAVRVLADAPPAIRLLRLSDDPALFGAGVVPFRLQAEDDFGLARVAVWYSVDGASGQEEKVTEDFLPGQARALDMPGEWSFGDRVRPDSVVEFALVAVDHAGHSTRSESSILSRRDRIITDRERRIAEMAASAAQAAQAILADVARLRVIPRESPSAPQAALRKLRKEENLLVSRVSDKTERLIDSLVAAENAARDTTLSGTLSTLRQAVESLSRNHLPELRHARALQDIGPGQPETYPQHLARVESALVPLEQATRMLAHDTEFRILEKEAGNGIRRIEAIQAARTRSHAAGTLPRLAAQEQTVLEQLASQVGHLRQLAERTADAASAAAFLRIELGLKKQGQPDGHDAHPEPHSPTSLPLIRSALASHQTFQNNARQDLQERIAELRSAQEPLSEEFTRLAGDLRTLDQIRSKLPDLEQRLTRLTRRDGLTLRSFDHPTGVVRAEDFDALQAEFTNRRELGADIADQVDVKGNPFGGQQFNFLLEYHGWIYVREPGTHTFGLLVDDCAYLKVGESVCARVPSCRYPLEVQPGDPVTLRAGRYPFTLLFSQATGDSELVAYWKRPGTREFERIPASAFVPTPAEPREASPIQKSLQDAVAAQHRRTSIQQTLVQEKLAAFSRSLHRESDALEELSVKLVRPRADLNLLSGVLGALRHRLGGEERTGGTPPVPGRDALQAVALAEPEFARQRALETVQHGILASIPLARECLSPGQAKPQEHSARKSDLAERIGRLAERVAEIETSFGAPDSPAANAHAAATRALKGLLRDARATSAAAAAHDAAGTQTAEETRILESVAAALDSARPKAQAICDAMTRDNQVHRQRLARLLPTPSEQILDSARELQEADRHVAGPRQPEFAGDIPAAVLEYAPTAMGRLSAVNRELDDLAVRLRSEALDETARSQPDAERALSHAAAADALDRIGRDLIRPSREDLAATFDTASASPGEDREAAAAIDLGLTRVLEQDALARQHLEDLARLLSQVEKALRGELGNTALRTATEALRQAASRDASLLERLRDTLNAEKKIADLARQTQTAASQPQPAQHDELARLAARIQELRNDLLRKSADDSLQKEELKRRALEQIQDDLRRLAAAEQATSRPGPQATAETVLRPYEPLVRKLDLARQDGTLATRPPAQQLRTIEDSVSKIPAHQLQLPQDPQPPVPPPDTPDPRKSTVPEQDLQAATQAADQLAQAADAVRRTEAASDARTARLATQAQDAARQAVATNEELARKLSKTLGGELSHDERTSALAEINAVQRPLRDGEQSPVGLASTLQDAAEQYRQAAEHIEPLVPRSIEPNRPPLEAIVEQVKQEAQRLDAAARTLSRQLDELRRDQGDLTRARQNLAAEADTVRHDVKNLVENIRQTDPDVRTQALEALADRIQEALTDHQDTEPLPTIQPIANNLRDRLNELADEMAGEAQTEDRRPAAQRAPETPVETLARAIPERPSQRPSPGSHPESERTAGETERRARDNSAQPGQPAAGDPAASAGDPPDAPGRRPSDPPPSTGREPSAPEAPSRSPETTGQPAAQTPGAEPSEQPDTPSQASSPSSGQPGASSQASPSSGQPGSSQQASSPTSGQPGSTPSSNPRGSPAQPPTSPSGQPGSSSQASSPSSGQPGAPSQASSPSGQPGPPSQASSSSGQPGAPSQASSPSGQPGPPSQASSPSGQPGAPSQASSPSGQPGAPTQPSSATQPGPGSPGRSPGAPAAAAGSSREQALSAAAGQVLSGLGRAQSAAADGQIPALEQGLSEAAQGIGAQLQHLREMAQDQIASPSTTGQGTSQPSGTPMNPAASQATPEQNRGETGTTASAGSPGGTGRRQAMAGAHSEWTTDETPSGQEWDKIGEAILKDSKQARGHDIPPHFRDRVKAYFDRLNEERRKAQSR